MSSKFLSKSSSSHNASENLSAELDSYNNFLQQFLNSASTNSSNSNNQEDTPQQYLKISSGNNSYIQNSEYETITTSVPESLAKKIIAEAQAAGAISRTTKFWYETFFYSWGFLM